MIQVGIVLLKTLFFCWLFVWARWTLPRIRYDQIMDLGWKVMLNVALVNLLVTAAIVKIVQQVFEAESVAKIVPRPELTTTERLYFVEIFKGLMTTFSHVVNAFKAPESLPIESYPEVKVDVPRDYRSRHRLMQRPDGEPRCVACYMCSTACPSRCINIVAEESDDDHIEKKPASFNIDLLLCIYCGMCVEACPCDAIRMDTQEAILVGDARDSFIINKDGLLDWNPSDYPADDIISQQAPGGSANADALADFNSGTGH